MKDHLIRYRYWRCRPIFFLTELLSGLPVAQYSDSLLLAVQSPFAQAWQKLSMAQLWGSALPDLVDGSTISVVNGRLQVLGISGGIGAATWADLQNKPFNALSNHFAVNPDGILALANNYSLIHNHPYLSDIDPQIMNWNTAFGWGNHAAAGYAFAHTHPYRPDTWIPRWGEVTAKPTWTEKIGWNETALTISNDLHVTGKLIVDDTIMFFGLGAGGGSGTGASALWQLSDVADDVANSVYGDLIMYNGTHFARMNQLALTHPHPYLSDSDARIGNWDTAYTHSQSAHYTGADIYAWAKAATKPAYTKAEVGLGNADNTADANKSVSYANNAGTLSGYGISSILHSTEPSYIDANGYDQQGRLESVYRHLDAFPNQANFPAPYGQLINFGNGASDFQFSVSSTQNELFFRSKWRTQAWTTFKKIYHSGNLTNALSTSYVPVWDGSTFVNSGFTTDIGYPYNRGIYTSADVGMIGMQAGSTNGWWSKINIAGRGTGTGIEFYTQSSLRLTIADNGAITTTGLISASNGINYSPKTYGYATPVYEDLYTYAGIGGARIQAGNTGQLDYGVNLRFTLNSRSTPSTPIYALELNPAGAVFGTPVYGSLLALGTGTLRTDATIHINGALGGCGRLTQMSPESANMEALNLIASKDGSNNAIWWSWGVRASGNFELSSSSGFGASGMQLTRAGAASFNTSVTAPNFYGNATSATSASNALGISYNGGAN